MNVREKLPQAYNSNKYQRTGHELASKTILQRDVVFDNPMSVFFQIHLFDWHSKCHHIETQVSHNWNMSAHPACMHLYKHIICPCIFLVSRFLLVNLGYCDGARIGGLHRRRFLWGSWVRVPTRFRHESFCTHHF